MNGGAACDEPPAGAVGYGRSRQVNDAAGFFDFASRGGDNRASWDARYLPLLCGDIAR